MEFTSWLSYQHFGHSVKHQARYVRADETNSFLQTVLHTAESRSEIIPPRRFLWCAQIGHGTIGEPICGTDDFYDQPVPFSRPRMKPLRNSICEGRANATGIPCLYLATNCETAMAEVRPWKGELVSVYQFKILRELRVVNCTRKSKRPDRIYVGGEPAADEREKYVWADLDAAFAKPISRSDNSVDYVPTQVIADLFGVHGFDGVAFRSSLGPGHNVGCSILTQPILSTSGVSTESPTSNSNSTNSSRTLDRKIRVVWIQTVLALSLG